MEPDTERAAESHAAAALVHADKIQRVNHQSEFGVAVPPQGADGVGPNQAPDWDILNCRRSLASYWLKRSAEHSTAPSPRRHGLLTGAGARTVQAVSR
jgi:hypothetical protein